MVKIVAILSLLLIHTFCSGQGVIDKDTTINKTIQVMESFELKFVDSPGSGHVWYFNKEFDTTHVKIRWKKRELMEGYRQKGGKYIHTYEYIGLTNGTYFIEYVYGRPWLHEELNRCNLKINVVDLHASIDSINNNSTLNGNVSIPDSVIQFLIKSTAKDFIEHQPPTATDFRNVKPGYILSDNKLTYLICGEFLYLEKYVWESFTTIKTSGYEQYIGGNIYCEKAKFIKADDKKLSEELKRVYNELDK